MRKNFALFNLRREMLAILSSHSAAIFEVIMVRNLEKSREALHRNWAFIEKVLLDLSRAYTRRERSLRRLQQRKDLVLFSLEQATWKVSSR